jgi:hypothetical protein
MKREIVTDPTELPIRNRRRGDQFLTSISVYMEVSYLYARLVSYYPWNLFDFPASGVRNSNRVDPPRRPGFKPGSGHVGFCDGQKWRWRAGFLRELRSPLPIYIPSASPQSSSLITRGWHKRPGVAAVPIASQTKYKKPELTHSYLLTFVRLLVRIPVQIHGYYC